MVQAQIKQEVERLDYTLRAEQQAAVEKTLEYYESGKEPREFLWNAKPRFGKTLTTYDFIRKIKQQIGTRRIKFLQSLEFMVR